MTPGVHMRQDSLRCSILRPEKTLLSREGFMRLGLVRRTTIITTVLTLLAASAWGADKRLITEKDIFKFVWVADPQISPDGSQVVFVKVTINEKNNDYETSLWSVSTSGGSAPQKLTSGTRDASPRWSPDGSRLAFVRAVERDKQPQPGQIFIL